VSDVISPKKPANVSALQPNQKRWVRVKFALIERRKIVEDEFAGSEEDE
jgi:hypothetical protein